MIMELEYESSCYSYNERDQYFKLLFMLCFEIYFELKNQLL